VEFGRKSRLASFPIVAQTLRPSLLLIQSGIGNSTGLKRKRDFLFTARGQAVRLSLFTEENSLFPGGRNSAESPVALDQELAAQRPADESNKIKMSKAMRARH
jgi:hypothetical protein